MKQGRQRRFGKGRQKHEEARKMRNRLNRKGMVTKLYEGKKGYTVYAYRKKG